MADQPGRVPLTEPQKKHLRRLAHPLEPIVTLGNAGLTDAVVKELDRALEDHELVKVRARAPDRHQRDAWLTELARRTQGILVQRIGNVAVIYRADKTLPRIVLP
jgi:RNA-binding protein